MALRRFGILALVGATALTAGALQLKLLASDPVPVEVVVNGNFNQGSLGWTAADTQTQFRIAVTDDGQGPVAVLAVPTRTKAFVKDDGGTVSDAPSGARYVASVLVRGMQRRGYAALVVKTSGPGMTSAYAAAGTQLSATGWTRLELPVAVTRNATDLEVRVRGTNLAVGDELLVDNVSLLAVNDVARAHAGEVPTPGPTQTSGPLPTGTPSPTASPTGLPTPTSTTSTSPRPSTSPTASPTTSPQPSTSPSPTVAPQPGQWALTNGCRLTTRGLPTCGALMGAGYNGNDDPSTWEQSLGQQLGVRRTYFQAGQVDGAMRIIREDHSSGRIPWVSFKAPYSWSEMASGRGDSWARDLAHDLAAADGPVWLAIHHEPEREGDIAQWTAMQQRLAPIIRGIAPNVAYSIVIMGYHSRPGGPAEYQLDSMMPRTTVDLLGIDPYNHYGKDGSTKHTDMVGTYFKPISAWAKAHGMAWAIAETGYTNAAAVDNPRWIQQTYDQLVSYGGVAFTYFNSVLNSFADWRLTTRPKIADFGAAVDGSPTLR